MSKTKEDTVQQWKKSLSESARTAVEALSAITPIDAPPPSTDEASKILGHAILKIRELVRPAPKTVAFLEEEAWYRMKGAEKPAGEYRTPKSALDFVLANPPFEKPSAAEPIQPGAPQMVQGEKPFTWLSLVNIPELNIEFHNFYTADFFKAVCYWENKEGERRVYEITVKPWSATGTSKWRARAQVCGKVLFYLEAASKSLAIECALVAMRRYLIRAHRCAWRTYRKASKAAAVPTVPTVPTVPAAPTPKPISPEVSLGLWPADSATATKEAEAQG